jgi:hypothetical protein
MATTAREGSRGENISHFTGVRLRVTGVGNLNMSFYSMDDINHQDLAPLPMSVATNIQPFRLANFNEQRASLKIGTTEFQEYFRINRIIIFSKELYTSYPG